MANGGSKQLLFLVPGDPDQRTGGYRYVSQLVRALNQLGAHASVEGLEGQFPKPDNLAEAAMDQRLASVDDGTTVILDGLAMGGLPGVVEKHSTRLNLVALVHHPLADETGISDEDRDWLFASEKRALAAVGRVITTSRHTAERLRDFDVVPDRIRVVEPGADTVAGALQTSEKSTGSATLQLLCVASLSPRKAQHQLVDALAGLRDLSWHCSLAGSTERNVEYSLQIRDQIRALGLDERITLTGELEDAQLADHYRNADLFVLPSLYEGYGMVIDEALAAGLPVVTTDGGALAATGNRPGVLQYPAGDLEALQACLQTCLEHRDRLQEMTLLARQSGESVRLWRQAAVECLDALDQDGQGRDHSQFDQQWLVLREPADHRARNRDLLEQAATKLETESGVLKIADLGAGAGSNGVYLSQRLPVPQHWTLLDQDARLLAEAAARLETEVERVEVIQGTLDAGNLDERIPRNTRLITASALIDLASAPWLDALADAAQSRQATVFIVLSYAGEFGLSPQEPDDDWLKSLVNDHQHGDKGSGSAMGPEATGYLKAQLESRRFEVAVAPSPWQLGAGDWQLQTALIAGWCEAAREQCPQQKARIDQWQSLRQRQAKEGKLEIRVDHHDLLAWPANG